MTRGGRRTSGGNLRGGGNSTTRSGSGRRDPAWDHGVRVEGPNPDSSYVYVKCNYCPQTITGGINRFKNHLACNHDNARPCPNVPPEVKTEMINFLKARDDRKNMRHENFDFLVSRGSYYQGGQGPHEEVCSGGGRGTSGSGSGRGPSGEGGSSHAGYDRYPYGPMDRYMSYGDVEEHEDPSSERKLTPVNEKEQRRQLCKEIGRFFIDNSIPFNAAASPSFVSMVNAIIRHRRPFKPPSPYELRTWILMEEVKTVDAEVKKVRETWPSTGVTIMSDGWKDIRGRQLINFLVNNPEGTVFLKSVDASDAIKDADLMYKMLEEVVLDVGPENVVQIVTDNASNYKAAGKKLMAEYPTLYWTPCAAHCIDLMLGDLFKLPQLSNAYRNGKKLIAFIYNHAWVLALMRKFTKKDLLRPATTRFGTAYLTLHSIFQNKAGLE